MRQDERAPFMAALHRARHAAYPPGAFIGQESFMTADEIRTLADAAAIDAATSVLDVCCGTGGPGRLLVAERACRYLGVDYSATAVAIAQELAAELRCRFVQAYVPPLPDGRYDVVLLLETLLAFSDKPALVEEVARVLRPGGRFAFTVEVGTPLSDAERDRMPDSDTVHLVQWADLTAMLAEAGCPVRRHREYTMAHQATATALLASMRSHAAQIANVIGTSAFHQLVTAHELWSDWLASGRVRKFAVIAQKL